MKRPALAFAALSGCLFGVAYLLASSVGSSDSFLSVWMAFVALALTCCAIVCTIGAVVCAFEPH